MPPKKASDCPESDLEAWARSASFVIRCPICHDPKALAWDRELRDIVTRLGVRVRISAQIAKLKQDTGVEVTERQMNRHRKNCDRA